MKAFENAAYHDEVESEQVTSSSIPCKLRHGPHASGSSVVCDECSEILHGLNNVLASMLLNAQVMEWKLPSYSRSKRYLHEIERSAQRGGELVKRLLVRLPDSSRGDKTNHGHREQASTRPEANIAVATQEPTLEVPAMDIPLGPVARSAPVFHSSRKKVPHRMM